MLRVISKLLLSYKSLTPTVSALKQTYNSPVFGITYAARRYQAAEKSPAWNGNCLVFAKAQKRRYGGHIISVKSQYGWWNHSYWVSSCGKVFEFAPVKPHRIVKEFWDPWPPVIYQGRKRVAPFLPDEAVEKILALNINPIYGRHVKPNLVPVASVPESTGFPEPVVAGAIAA